MIQRALFIGLLLLSSTTGSAQDFEQILDSLKQIVVEHHIIDMDKDGKNDQIILRQPPYGDPGQFDGYEIILSSGESLSKTPSGLDFSEGVEFGIQNRVNSQLLYIPKLPNKTYIFFFGTQYGCCLKELICYEIVGEKIVQRIASRVQVAAIGDFNSDGILNIEGTIRKAEAWGSSTSQVMYHSIAFEWVFDLEDSLVFNNALTYARHPEERQKNENYLDLVSPVEVIRNDTNEKYIVEQKELNGLIERAYPFASVKKLEADDLNQYSKQELRLIRNEIFAAYGYIFNSKDLSEYFRRQFWYRPRFKNVTNRLTEIEKYNIQQILTLEK